MKMGLGLLAGLGDAAERQNAENDRMEHEQRQQAWQSRKDFADQLLTIGTSDDWPEEARAAALHGRLGVLNNPKLKDKDFDNIWLDVMRTSRRSAPGKASPAPGGAQSAGSADGGASVLAQLFNGFDAASGAGGGGMSADMFARNPAAVPSAPTNAELPADWNAGTPTPLSMLEGPYTRGERTQEALSTLEQELQLRQRYNPSAAAQFPFDSSPMGIYDRRTGELKAAAPPKMGDMSDFERTLATATQIFQQENGRDPNPQEFYQLQMKTKKDLAEAGRDPDADTRFDSMMDYRRHLLELSNENLELRRQKMAQGADPSISMQRELNAVDKLSQRWMKAQEPVREMRRQYGLMQVGMKRFDKDPNGASQAVLVTFQKILDPTSVVRESEYARSAYGVSLLQRIEGFVDRLANGGAGVPKSELQQMVNTAKGFLDSMEQFNSGVRKRIMNNAKEYNLDPDLIFDDLSDAERRDARKWTTSNSRPTTSGANNQAGASPTPPAPGSFAAAASALLSPAASTSPPPPKR